MCRINGANDSMKRLARRTKRRKKKKWETTRLIDVVASVSEHLLMLLCVLCFGLMVITRNAEAKKTIEEYARQESKLTKELKEEESKHKYLLDYKEYVKTDEYIIDTATRKLGLVDKDTIVIRSKERFE